MKFARSICAQAATVHDVVYREASPVVISRFYADVEDPIAVGVYAGVETFINVELERAL